MIRSSNLMLVAGSCLLAVAFSVPAFAGDPAGAAITIVHSGTGPTGPAQPQAGATYRVTARVPVECWVRPDSAVTSGEGNTGSVVEACNNPGGFTVTASYRPLKETEKAQLVYDNRAIDLARSGAQLLRQSSMAVIKRINYRFQAVELDEPLVLSLTIQPI